VELKTAIPGVDGALRELSRDYGLGIVANQLREVVGALEAFSWDGLFRVLAVSEVIGLEKPDPAIFQWALDKAGCSPEESVMVGDRVDNDIAPANGMGMWTIWVHIPHDQRGSRPRNRKARLYLESQMRVSVTTLRPRKQEEIPHLEASSSREMLKAVREIDRRSRTGFPGRG
jgi:HAD superfamily hydrolase (TIGR01662 family)